MGLVIFQPAENHIESQPNKLFEYLSAGLPIVASNFPLWREIVEGNGVGIVVDPTNSQEVADAISFLLKNPELCAEMGGRARALIEARLNWNVEARKLIEFYRRIGLGAL
jgi:glycosyltransferase involved in cell wall biosynthesis